MTGPDASRFTLSKGAPHSDHPIVFACAGCSFAGRLAYELAQEFDQRGIAQMSCLAGLAADLPYFRRQVEGRLLWIIDGCPLECTKEVFRRTGHEADAHIRLHELGIKKHSSPEEGVEFDSLVSRATDSVHLAHTFSPIPKGIHHDPDTAES